MSLYAGVLKRISVVDMNVIGPPYPSNVAFDWGMKPVPITVSTVSPASLITGVDAGDTDVMTGVGLTIGIERGLDVPPLGDGLKTTTVNEPGFATSAAVSCVRSSVALTNSVGLSTPF